LVVARNDRDALAAHRAHDALLAQPLRLRTAEGPNDAPHVLAERTLRAHALGDFGVLLHAIAQDPAMLVYLDGVRNRKARPTRTSRAR
jgi:hypothetical protein